jgi:hypothetical protein
LAKPMYEILGEDANGDDWFAAADDPAVADAFAKQFRDEGLTNVRTSKIDASQWTERSFAPPHLS